MIFKIVVSLLLIQCNAKYKSRYSSPGGSSNYFGGGGGNSYNNPSGGNYGNSNGQSNGGNKYNNPGGSNYGQSYGGGDGYANNPYTNYASSGYSGNDDSVPYKHRPGHQPHPGGKPPMGMGRPPMGMGRPPMGGGRPSMGGRPAMGGGSGDVCSRSEDQLPCFKQNQKYTPADRVTTLEGQPIGDFDNSKTCGERGPLLVEDHLFLKNLFHFDKERIPERVVHAKGAGAYGFFTAQDPEIQKYSKAAVFKPGTETPLFVRFSQVAPELGSPDTVRDVRGFAVKFYTSDGIWDLTGNNLPVFFIRDARMFPSFVHSQKRNPQTHLRDPNAHFDFWSLRNETSHQFMHVYSPLGLPASYRMMNGFGVHTFKLVNEHGEYFYCKFHYESDQGVATLTQEEADRLAASSPDFLLKDLYDAIARKEYPSWTFYIQVMTPEQAANHIDNPFDATKVWDRDQFPLIRVGQFVLSMNPENYFADVEQSAFDPANLPPGIEPSPDKLLQGRLFSYLDTQFYRLGANFNMLPVNQAKNKVITPQDRDGRAVFTDNFGGMPNYVPNSFLNADIHDEYLDLMWPSGDGFVARYDFDASRNLVQAGEFFMRLSQQDKEHLTNALAGHLSQCTVPMIVERMFVVIDGIHPELGEAIRRMVGSNRQQGRSVQYTG